VTDDHDQPCCFTRGLYGVFPVTTQLSFVKLSSAVVAQEPALVAQPIALRPLPQLLRAAAGSQNSQRCPGCPQGSLFGPKLSLTSIDSFQGPKRGSRMLACSGRLRLLRDQSRSERQVLQPLPFRRLASRCSSLSAVVGAVAIAAFALGQSRQRTCLEVRKTPPELGIGKTLASRLRRHAPASKPG